MKNFRVTLATSEKTIKADKFIQVDGFVSFYKERDGEEPSRVVALIRMGDGDSVVEEQ